MLSGQIKLAAFLIFMSAVGLGGSLLEQERYRYSDFDPQPMPMVAASVAGGGVEHCGPWVRDGYVSVQVNVDAYGCNIVGDAANEPSIAIDPSKPRKIVIGWRQFDTVLSDFRQAGWGYSHDGGHTWVFPGTLDPGVFGTDPVLASDGDGRIFYLTTDYAATRVFRSDDGGLTWPVEALIEPRLWDKAWMAVDRTDGVGRGNVYVMSPAFARSSDGGQTFAVGPEWAVFAHMSVARDGTFYVVSTPPRGAPGANIKWSSNAQDPNQAAEFSPQIDFAMGGTLRYQGPPNPVGLLAQPWVAIDESDSERRGCLYVLASIVPDRSDETDVHFVRSTDGGVTWSDPIRVNDDTIGNGAWQWFGMMSLAPNGRIDAAWNDTRSSEDAVYSELFYSYSLDGGENWSKNVPVSPQFNSHVGWPQQAKIGDYYHMISDNLGVNIAYAATFNNEQDVYFLRIGPHDCNGNEIPDEDDITAETSLDCNGNAVPDECEYRADFDGDSLTTLDDHAHFVNCQQGTTPLNSPLGKGGGSARVAPDLGCCALFDMEPDGDIDLRDFSFLQRAFAP